MKKKLLLIVLALAILTSLTAGTLAVYTKTVSKTEQVEAKRFTFNVAGDIVGSYGSFNMAPGEEKKYAFTIDNGVSTGTVAEVPLRYDITVTYTEARANMPGLVAKLYNTTDGSTEIGEYNAETGQIKFTASSTANNEFNESYVVIVTWVNDTDTSENNPQTLVGTNKYTNVNGITVSVSANQVM